MRQKPSAPRLIPLLAWDNTSALQRYKTLRNLLVYFDDVSLWIVEEHLMPFFGKCSTIVRVWNILTIKQLLKGFYIISPERNMPSLNWVNSFTMLEADF